MGRTRVFLSVVFTASLVSACVTASADRRTEEWRAILAAEAPVGAPAASAERALARRGIAAARGTYVTVGDDGVRRSNCPDPEAAVSGRETADKVGFNSNVIEITACLDRRGRVHSHYVGVWIQ